MATRLIRTCPICHRRTTMDVPSNGALAVRFARRFFDSEAEQHEACCLTAWVERVTEHDRHHWAWDAE